MDDFRDYSQGTRALQILCGALMMGMMSFAAVAIFLVNVGGMGQDGELLIPLIMGGIGFTSIPPTQFVGMQIKSQKPEAGSTEEGYIGQYRGGSLIGWAGLEGAAFANLVAYILAGQWWSLVIPGVCLCWMALTFPTEAKLKDWLRHRLQEGDL